MADEMDSDDENLEIGDTDDEEEQQ